MAIRLKKVLEKTLRSFITDEEVRQTAEETGFIRRFRKLEAVKLFWAMMLSFGMGLSKGIEDIRRAYHQTPETSRIARSSFYERLTPEMTLFMKNLLEKVMGRMAKPAHKLEKMLSAFKNLVLIDSTLIKLHDKLKNVFRATGRNAGNKPTEAEAKVQVTIGANSPAPLFLHISGSAKYELESVEIGDWGQRLSAAGGPGILQIRPLPEHSQAWRIFHKPGYPQLQPIRCWRQSAPW